MKRTYTLNNTPHPLDLTRVGDTLLVETNGTSHSLQIISITPPRLTFLYNNRLITARVAADKNKRWIHLDGATLVLEQTDPTARRASGSSPTTASGSGLVTAPMPGQVRAVLVSIGDTVSEGQPLLLLEAMKMELRVTAPLSGTVQTLRVKPGDTVERDQELAQIESNSDNDS